MDEELIKMLPNHVVMTREFDFYRADAEYYANRLKKYGKLSELYILPGSSHYTKSEQLAADKKKIINHFL
jgi:acetyl esterase/lipase